MFSVKLYKHLLIHFLTCLIQGNGSVFFLNFERLYPELLDTWSHVVELNVWVQFPQEFFCDDEKVSILLPLIAPDELLLVDCARVWMTLALMATKLLRLLENLSTYLASESSFSNFRLILVFLLILHWFFIYIDNLDFTHFIVNLVARFFRVELEEW